MIKIKFTQFIIFTISTLLFSVVIFFGADKAFAATVTWDGGEPSSHDWSNGSNWVGDQAPQNGDDIVLNCDGNHGCVSSLDIDLEVESIHFVGTGNEYAAVLDTSMGDPHLTVNGNITSDTPGSFIVTSGITLGANVVAHNFSLSGGESTINLNGFNLGFTGTGRARGNEIGNPTGPHNELSIYGQIIGNGNISIDVEPNTEVQMNGDTASTYTGSTTIVNGTVSSGRANLINSVWVPKSGANPTNTPYIFGNSTVTVEQGGKIWFFLDEDNDGQSMDNDIILTESSFTNTQLEFINITADDSLVNFAVPNIELQSNNRFDALTENGNLLIDLAGINNDNQYCVVYGLDDLQADSFVNGPDCTDDEPPVDEEPAPEEPPTIIPISDIPGVPNSGAVINAGAIIGGSTSLLSTAWFIVKKLRF